MTYLVGAYAAAPHQPVRDPGVEAAYLDRIAAIPGFGGLELPFADTLHADEEWLLSRLDASWDLVVTSMPGTPLRVKADPTYGLASPVEAGRLAAMDHADAMRRAVHRLNDNAGRRAVVGVELHSAPGAIGDADSFARSLEQLIELDWDGCTITVEHCDAAVPGRDAQKGYLPLPVELDIVGRLGGAAGVTVNWGRSAIEGRSAGTALEHVRAAAEAGLLRGLMFSGASEQNTAYGPPWVDAHHPPAKDADPAFADLAHLEPTSLLGPGEIRAALADAGTPVFTGLKIGVRPVETTLDVRVAHVADALSLLDRVAAQVVL